MSDLIRREDAARIAEDHNLDIWEYSTGNRSRIGHDPVAEAIRALPAVHLATNAELEALKKDAGIPHLPTQLTFEARLAISGEGPRAYDWSDKPHRIVYDLCREIEKNAAERDRLRGAIETISYYNTVGYTDMALDAASAALKGETP